MNAFKTIRERLEMTQTEIASALEMTQGNVSFYERDAQDVPPGVAAKLIALAAKRGLKIGYDHVYGAAALPPERRKPEAKAAA